jgi:hypothetical protein
VNSAQTNSLAPPTTEQLTALAGYPQSSGNHPTNNQDLP